MKYLAICFIWLAVAATAFFNVGAAVMISFCAIFATGIVADSTD